MTRRERAALVEGIARECYRRLYPGGIGTPGGQRTRESDAAERDQAYDTCDRGREAYAPGRICRSLAENLVSGPVGHMADSPPDVGEMPERERRLWKQLADEIGAYLDNEAKAAPVSWRDWLYRDDEQDDAMELPD